LRRILYADLASGFSAWVELWSAKVWAMQRLRDAGNHMRSPEIATAFRIWMGEWDEERRQAAQSALLQSHEGPFQEQIEHLRKEVEKLHAKHEVIAEEHQAALKAALDQQRAELIGNADEQAALRAEQERAERVEMLSQKSMRRMLNSDLACGFDAWWSMWHTMRQLRQIAGRLREPALASAFAFWAEDSRELKRVATLEGLETQCKSNDERVKQAELTAAQLRMIDVAQKDEIKHLQQKLAEFTDLTNAQSAELEVNATQLRPALESVRDSEEQLKRLLREQQEMTATAEKKRAEVESEAAQKQQAAQELLERLIAEQRATFDADLVELRQAVTTHGQERGALQADLTAVRAELERVQKELAAAKAKLEPPKEAPKDRRGTVGGKTFEFDPDSERSASEQLAMALKAGATRVLDLFRQWDTDGDGSVSKAEFLSGLPKLGFNIDKKYIEELFDEWDKDGGGELSFGELKKVLSAVPRASAANKKSVKAAGSAVKAASRVAKSAAPDGGASPAAIRSGGGG